MTTIIPNGSWLHFTDQRPGTAYVHLDTAAAGRSSRATLDAVAAHAELEATAGAYVAAASAAPVIEECRAGLAGLTGVDADGIAFTESATAALGALLRAWPLSFGDTVAVAQSEWGPNLDAFAARGLRVVELPVDGAGIVAVDALPGFFGMQMPALVHLTPVSSHRPLVQPAGAVAAVCREFGIPLWADAAQGLGHADISGCGADAVYGTSRKWLTGPRGVGFLGIGPSWLPRLRPRASDMDRGAVGDGSPALLLESREAHVAGRVGLANAVSEFLAAGPAAVWERLASVGALTRSALDSVEGWSVVGSSAAPSAITALRPLAGQDVTAVRSALLAEHKIVTTAALPVRAPRDMTSGYLRVSPHVDVTDEDLARLAAALPAS
ncbi:MAG: aminotransferase class V-fold PLP-dependent enzyme [Streptosporangiales bacterium]|nr:aminotransferase class V-fold PLP-dependent enzyme [Streptosporangiales bacterium]